MNIIPGYSGDYRTLDKLVNNKNQTCNDRNMWLIPFCPGKSHFLIIDLKQQTVITEIHF